MCFFCQAEDGIRDLTVTGVQTCALPILVVLAQRAGVAPGPAAASAFVIQAVSLGSGVAVVAAVTPHSAPPLRLALAGLAALATILVRSEEHTSELQSQSNLVCRLLLEKKKKKI